MSGEFKSKSNALQPTREMSITGIMVITVVVDIVTVVVIMSGSSISQITCMAARQERIILQVMAIIPRIAICVVSIVNFKPLILLTGFHTLFVLQDERSLFRYPDMFL